MAVGLLGCATTSAMGIAAYTTKSSTMSSSPPASVCRPCVRANVPSKPSSARLRSHRMSARWYAPRAAESAAAAQIGRAHV